ncbi:MAG: tRNA uridine-5-carboxymethylaminomethyl(34) synthesis GTPase MnmE [Gammaproteobacteria bacterium]|nr:tRNA uridine-5-carboxymethylaminomethyl(34) synthesis GTPase MnmE [Gammaproteobacteria bacterium]
MASSSTDTIAAIATAHGYGGIGIVRISGPAVPAIAAAVLGRVPRARHATFSPFLDASAAPIDAGIALYYPAPRSYTGEDVLELQGHGGPVVLELLLERVVQAGARRARPGEFSERAFLNGRIDLAQAEAVADLIASTSARAARAATRTLQGAFSQRVHALTEALIALRVDAEASIDFSVDDIEPGNAFTERLERLLNDVAALRTQARAGTVLRDGVDVVIAGAPNAGKSSLLNRLARSERAIVTPVPGTTRDLVREQIVLNGLPLQIVDPAGLREDADSVEAEGIRRAQSAIRTADEVLLVSVAGQEDDGMEARVRVLLAPGARLTRVVNKIDLVGWEAAVVATGDATEIRVCAVSGAGIDALEAHLCTARAGRGAPGEGDFTARARHVDALTRVHDTLACARDLETEGTIDLFAEHLRLAQLTLAEITGDFTADDLLGAIFSSFCIGK